MADFKDVAGPVSELAFMAMQMYFKAMEESGHTVEEAKDIFLENYPKFMDESAGPIEDVKENL